MSNYMIHIIEALLTPPGFMFAMILLGFMVGSRFARLGRELIISGLLLLVLASLPATRLLVFTLLESDSPQSQEMLANSGAQAIVILGGGRYSGIEYGKETVSLATLERLRYGAWVQQQTGLPILVSGGSVRGESNGEAKLMAHTLSTSLGASPKWIEDKSRNTWENAQYSWSLLNAQKISHILLVTHANHMLRARSAFTRQGFTVTPAPLGFKSRAPLTPQHFLPSAYAMADLKTAFHELIGQLWYSIHY